MLIIFRLEKLYVFNIKLNEFHEVENMGVKGKGYRFIVWYQVWRPIIRLYALPPGQWTCSFACHFNSTESIQYCSHFGALDLCRYTKELSKWIVSKMSVVPTPPPPRMLTWKHHGFFRVIQSMLTGTLKLGPQWSILLMLLEIELLTIEIATRWGVVNTYFLHIVPLESRLITVFINAHRTAHTVMSVTMCTLYEHSTAQAALVIAVSDACTGGQTRTNFRHCNNKTTTQKHNHNS